MLWLKARLVEGFLDPKLAAHILDIQTMWKLVNKKLLRA